MIKKSFRLSNGFWHRFLPNSNKLFSPQNIPLEIWDIEKQIKESKWNPEIYGIENLTFSNCGDKFVICGGWITSRPNKSEFKVYDIHTFDCIDEFVIMEKCSNPAFTKDDKNLIFCTWDGNIYCYSFVEKSLKKQFSIENYVFHSINTGKHNGVIYISGAQPRAIKDNWTVYFIFEYLIEEKNGRKLEFTDKRNPNEKVGETNLPICGLALNNNNLAIMTSKYAGKVDGINVCESKVYIYNTDSKNIKLIKENFKINESVFDELGSIVWSKDGKLAFIGLNEIYIVDINNNLEKTIMHNKATSLEFSNCGTGIAVGGSKAKLYKI